MICFKVTGGTSDVHRSYGAKKRKKRDQIRDKVFVYSAV